MIDDDKSRPSLDQLRAELDRVSRKRRGSVFGKILLVLLILILVVAVLAVIFLPGFVIYGDSMSPSLEEGDLTLSWPYGEVRSGDLIAFRYGERVLVKRVIAVAGDTVEILTDGTVEVNHIELDEPYAIKVQEDGSDMEYPLLVPAGSYFVLGDNRANSVDSRNSIVGYVHQDQIIGRIFLVVWPFARIHLIGGLPHFL